MPLENAATAMAPAKLRRCPFCAEEILAEAKKCKHCGEFIDQVGFSTAKQSSFARVLAKSKITTSLLVVIAVTLLTFVGFGTGTLNAIGTAYSDVVWTYVKVPRGQRRFIREFNQTTKEFIASSLPKQCDSFGICKDLVIRSSGKSHLSKDGAVCDLTREFDRVQADYAETYGVPFHNVILVDESGRQYGSAEISNSLSGVRIRDCSSIPPEIH
jgi:hypothetical protein